MPPPPMRAGDHTPRSACGPRPVLGGHEPSSSSAGPPLPPELAQILAAERERIDALAAELDEDATYPHRRHSETTMTGTAGSAVSRTSSSSPAVSSESSFESLEAADPDKHLRRLKERLAHHGSAVGSSRTTTTPRKEASVTSAATQRQGVTETEVLLTPEQRHYLVRALVTIQMADESEQMFKVGALTRYGPPFSVQRPVSRLLHDELNNEYTLAGSPSQGFSADPFSRAQIDLLERTERIDDPILFKQLLHTSLLTIPFLSDMPDHFWHSRIQPFLDEVAVRSLATSLESAQIPSIRYMLLLLVGLIGHYFARGVGVRASGELQGPSRGSPETEAWGMGKAWSAGTVKRGLDRPARIDSRMQRMIDDLFLPGAKLNYEGSRGIQERIYEQWKMAGKHVRLVHADFHAFWERVIEQPQGLNDTWRYTTIPAISELPLRFQSVAEHLRDAVAGWLRQLLTKGPHADTLFRLIKGVYTLFPWWAAKQTLKVANARLIIQGFLSILLARPGGAKSLIQRIVGFVCHREMKIIEKEGIKPLSEAVRNEALVHKVVAFVKHAGRMERVGMTANTRSQGDDILTTILLTSDHGPDLSQHECDRVVEMQRAFALSKYRGHLEAAYPPGSSRYSEKARKDANQAYLSTYHAQKAGKIPMLGAMEAQDAYHFALLKLLLREALAKHDFEMFVETADGALLPTMIKEFLEGVVYPIVDLAAKHTDLSAHLGDLQRGVEDLIKTRQGKDNSIHAWIALATRHYEKVWYFAHKMVMVEDISCALLTYCQLQCNFMATSSSDPQRPNSRDARRFEVNCEHLLAKSATSPDDLADIVAELDQLQSWALWEKVRAQLLGRQNVLLAHDDANPPAGLGRTQIASRGFGQDANDIDMLMEHLMVNFAKHRLPAGTGALAALRAGIAPPITRIDTGRCTREARGTETRDDPGLYFNTVDPCGQHLLAEPMVSDLRYVPDKVAAPAPTLLHVRRLLPAFRAAMRRALPSYSVTPDA